MIIKDIRAMGKAKGKEFIPRSYPGGRQKGGLVTAIEEVAAEIEKQSFDEVWAVIADTLESEHRTCQKNQIEVYKNCLISNSGETTDWLDLVTIIKTHRVA